MNTKVSVVILTKDEGKELSNCINHIRKHVDDVIIVDSSNNNEEKIISNELKCTYYNKKIGDKNIKGFNDLRNFGQSSASNDWCLHIDVDERIPDRLFQNLDSIICGSASSKDNNTEKTKVFNAYAFPRVNLPFYELYPDYQTRLVNRLKVEWINEIHEKADIFTEPYEVGYLNDYPIIHLPKNRSNKLEINKRWSLINNTRNILICSLFKDCEKYIDTFLSNLKELIEYSSNQNFNIELCFIEGDSSDNTYSKLKNWLENIVQKDIKYKFKILNIPMSIDRFTSLAILRNMSIKLGLKSYHDYILVIDSDTIFNRNLLERLTKSIEINQCDVISPLPFIENFRNYGNEYMYDTLAFIDNNNVNFQHDYPYTPEMERKDLIKVTGVGTCYLIKADIYNINDFKDFSIMKCYSESNNKVPLIYEGTDDNNNPVSEQVLFFKKLKRKGYQVYVDSTIKILHVNLEKLGMEWH